MDFHQYTLGLLLLRTDASSLSEAEQNALQDAHMAYLSELHDRGELLAAGPVLGPPERELRGFGIYPGDSRRASELADQDPAVRAGRYRHEFHSWLVPAGLVSFTPGRLPASMAEAAG